MRKKTPTLRESGVTHPVTCATGADMAESPRGSTRRTSTDMCNGKSLTDLTNIQMLAWGIQATSCWSITVRCISREVGKPPQRA